MPLDDAVVTARVERALRAAMDLHVRLGPLTLGTVASVREVYEELKHASMHKHGGLRPALIVLLRGARRVGCDRQEQDLYDLGEALRAEGIIIPGLTGWSSIARGQHTPVRIDIAALEVWFVQTVLQLDPDV